MLLVCSSDWHGDWQTLGVPRLDEVAQAVDQSVRYAIEHKADYYLFLGDLSDPDTGGLTFQTICLAQSAALQLARKKISSIFLAGNHDVVQDGSGATTLTPLKSLLMADANAMIRVVERPEIIEGALRFVCLPYTAPSHGYDPAAFAKEAKVDRNTIVLSHLSISGIHPGSETTLMPRGREISFPVKETTKAKLRLQGHYHRRQKFDFKDGGVPAQIVGSLMRLDFGEEGNDPGFLTIEV